MKWSHVSCGNLEKAVLSDDSGLLAAADYEKVNCEHIPEDQELGGCTAEGSLKDECLQ